MSLPALPLPATPFVLPLVAPFRGLQARQGVVLEGPGGWGEFAPFADYSVDQDARWLVAAIEAALDPDPGPGTAVATNAILPDLSDDDLAAGTTRVMAATGCRTVKLKVGGRPTGAELARVTTVMQAAAAVDPDARLRLDGNGRFDFAAAQEFLVALTWADAAVEYVEQPCRSVDEMRLLKEHVPDVALAADESLRRDRHFHDLAEIADVAIVKVAPLGGPRAVRSVLADIDLPVVVSGAAESSVGLSRDAVVAAQVGAPERAHGLGTGTLLAADLVEYPVIPVAGQVPARRAVADTGPLAEASARMTAADQETWRIRLQDAWHSALHADLLAAEDLSALGIQR